MLAAKLLSRAAWTAPLANAQTKALPQWSAPSRPNPRHGSSHSAVVAPSKCLATDIAEQLQQDPAFADRLAQALGPEAISRMAKVARTARAEEREESEVHRPTRGQLSRLAVRQGIPFFCFGVFDNMIMISVGDTIDATFGVALGFSTMAAAGLGQMVSDSAGVTLQGVIERFADRLGLPDPNLSAQQERLGLCKTIVQASRTVGICCGCLLGMFPLLILEGNRPRDIDRLLSMLPADRRAEFKHALQDVRYSEGEKIVELGSHGEYLTLLVDGDVDVVGRDAEGREVKACQLTAGAVIGELEFLHGEPCCCDVIATSPVRAQRLSKEDFLRIVGRDKLQTLSKDLKDTRYLFYRLRQGWLKDPKSQEESPPVG